MKLFRSLLSPSFGDCWPENQPRLGQTRLKPISCKVRYGIRLVGFKSTKAGIHISVKDKLLAKHINIDRCHSEITVLKKGAHDSK